MCVLVGLGDAGAGPPARLCTAVRVQCVCSACAVHAQYAVHAQHAAHAAVQYRAGRALRAADPVQLPRAGD